MSALIVSNLSAFTAWPALLALGAVDLRLAGIFVICLVLAITIHEFSHAFVAHKLGDRTPESQGRLTLNPVAHADPIGTLALPIALAVFAPGMLIGWGRPVQTNPTNYTRRFSMRTGSALVALAGPASNLMLAVLIIAVVAGLAAAGVLPSGLSSFHPLRVFFNLNILLFVFNLIPVGPLDGHKVLGGILPSRYQGALDFLERYGVIILLVLVFSPIPILGYLLGPFFALGNWALDAVV